MRSVYTWSCAVLVSSVLLHHQGLHGWAEEWGWRGPTHNGIATSGQELPDQWSTDKNVLWVADVPGRGHASPIVAGGKVLLATADENEGTQSVLCFDVQTGRRLWMTECHTGQPLPKIHPKNTQASPSVAVGNDHAFAVFCNDDSVHVTCLDFSGKITWQKNVGRWLPTRYEFGFGQSPIFYNGKLIVTAESETEPFVMALDPANGQTIWRIERPKATSYGTPVVATVNGKEQLLISGGQKVASYDPESGEELWSTDATWVVACGTMVWHRANGLVYASGGYPTKQTLAIKADGSGDIAWENKVKCYEQSLLVVDDCVYGHAEGGVLYCWDAATGEELWVQRLEGNESASPVFAGGKIHVTNEDGQTWVFRPNREKFELVATNKLGDEMFASMAVVNNRILMRVADRLGERKEQLYCIGNK